jgi:hypothetical protein
VSLILEHDNGDGEQFAVKYCKGRTSIETQHV